MAEVLALECSGEMGFGNSTAAAAIAAVIPGAPPDAVTGPGTGLSDAGRRHYAIGPHVAVAHDVEPGLVHELIKEAAASYVLHGTGLRPMVLSVVTDN